MWLHLILPSAAKTTVVDQQAVMAAQQAWEIQQCNLADTTAEAGDEQCHPDS